MAADIDRTIGRLEATVERLEEAVTKLDSRVEGIQQWRWKIVGGSMAISAVVSIIVSAIKFAVAK